MVLVTLEYGYKSIKHNIFTGKMRWHVNVPWPWHWRRNTPHGIDRPRKDRVEWDRELWQEMELVPSMRARLKDLAREGMGEVDVVDSHRGEEEDDEDSEGDGDVESATIPSSG